MSYPNIYDFFIGDRIINEHIKEVIGNETNPDKVANLLMNWAIKNLDYPLTQEKVNLFSLKYGNGLYIIDNKTRLFIRDGPASWIIRTKLARCGESATYFVEIMDKLGYKARIIHTKSLVWDHAWAEYYNASGDKINVDPSSNRTNFDKEEWVKGKNITTIIAVDLKGNEEDITSEYLS
jgi:hypothetical protein